jgi:hypothetical protein
MAGSDLRLLDRGKLAVAGGSARHSDRQLRAHVLEQIPDSGIVLSVLADRLPEEPDRVRQAVARLGELGLVEADGDIIRTTPFAQKAKRIFHIR